MLDSLNQKSLPCFKTNQRRRHVLMYSPCLVSHPVRSGVDQNSMFEYSDGVGDAPVTARHRLAAAIEVVYIERERETERERERLGCLRLGKGNVV